MSDLSAVVGASALFVSVGVGALALYLLRGKARLEAILSAFAQVTLVPERRRRFLLLLWVEAVCFLVTGVLLGLYRLGVMISSDPDALFTATFLAGMITLGALVWVGLSPRPLTAGEKAAVERDAPVVLQSVWAIPYRVMDESPENLRKR